MSKTIGEIIINLRKSNGLTQAAFAKEVGIGSQKMCFVETNKRPLTANDKDRIVARFDLRSGFFEVDDEGNAINQEYSDKGLTNAPKLLVKDLPEPNKRIYQLRQSLGLSQAEFAEKAGLTQANISSIESGRRAAGKYVQNAVKTAFKVNHAWWEKGSGRMIR